MPLKKVAAEGVSGFNPGFEGGSGFFSRGSGNRCLMHRAPSLWAKAREFMRAEIKVAIASKACVSRP